MVRAPVLDATQITDAELERVRRPVRSDEDKPHPYFIFRVGETWLGVPAAAVPSVLDDQGYSPIPATPPHVLGVITWRDQVIALLDVARFCGLPRAANAGAFARTVVLEDGPLVVGVRVEAAAGVVELSEREMQMASALQGEQLLPYLAAETVTPWGVAGILDVRRLLEAARVRGD